MLHITTDRLTLRPFEARDAEALISIAGSPSIERWLPDWKEAGDWVPGWIEMVKEHYIVDDPMRKFVCLAVVRNEDGALIGQVGCGDFESKEIGVSYFIDEKEQLKGYAVEAMRGFIPLLMERYNLDHIIATIQPDNIASRKVAERLGFRYQETIHIKDNGQTEVLPFCYYKLMR